MSNEHTELNALRIGSRRFLAIFFTLALAHLCSFHLYEPQFSFHLLPLLSTDVRYASMLCSGHTGD